MQAATGEARLPEPEDEVREALFSRGPLMFTAPEKHQARLEALQTAVEGAMEAAMEPPFTLRLSRQVLERKLEVLRRALTGESAADRTAPRRRQAGCNEGSVESKITLPFPGEKWNGSKLGCSWWLQLA